MENTDPRFDVWLQFQKTDGDFTVTRTAAYGRAPAMPISLGSWKQVSTALEQAGFSANSIRELKERLEDHAVAIVGPVRLTPKQLAVLGIQQAA